MGQYHKVYNLDRKEFIHPHKIDCGLKLVEQMLISAMTNSEGVCK